MANWKEYTTKTTPEDADEIMIADSKANVSKRTPFSGLWNWIAGKLATAVISQLETQNKSIIPAINELSSKTSIYIHDPAKGTNITITIPNNKMALVSYSKITSSNISYTGFGIIVSRVRDEFTGKLTEIQSVENISLSLEGNKLIASSESWFRIIVTVL